MPKGLKHDILDLARATGFDLAGVAAPAPLPADPFRQWLAAGRAADMAYLHANIEKRLDPCVLVPGAKSILCLGLNYFQAAPTPPGADGRIALYAFGRDYHAVVKEMLHRLAGKIRHRVGRDFAYRAFVDTAPVAERALAHRAGLGWPGKNTCLIHPDFGSYFFLSELFLDFDLPPDTPQPNRCGQCNECLKACPTGALVAPGVLDARRCLSYLTIEHHGQFPPDLGPAMTDTLFGCDRCQQACPFNARCPETATADFRQHRLGPALPIDKVLHWTQSDYEAQTADSPGTRAPLTQWQRNAQFLRQNQVPRP